MVVPARRLLTYWLPPLLWLGLIFFLSSRSTLPIVPMPSEAEVWFRPYVSPLAHATEYGVLGLLAFRAAVALGLRRRIWVGVLLFGVGVSLADEGFQSTVPGRVAEVADLLADGLGTTGALVMASLWRRWRGRGG